MPAEVRDAKVKLPVTQTVLGEVIKIRRVHLANASDIRDGLLLDISENRNFFAFGW